MKKIFTLAAALAIMLCCTCAATAERAPKDTWLIYWYVCGSSLESGSEQNVPGQATKDLEELAKLQFKVISETTIQTVDGESGRGRPINSSQSQTDITDRLEQAIKAGDQKRFPNYLAPEDSQDFPSNVKVLIQTGGSQKWFTADIPDNTIGRFVYDNSGVHYQGSFADADMGSVDTLADFLRYGRDVIEKDFNPTHRMFIFWNHGGLAGVCYDERSAQENFLDLNDINEAFGRVFKAAPNNPPFEIIGFDACVRATYENANNIYGFAKCMVASEENESDYGWYYTDWIRQLERYPSISGKVLGQIICRTSFDYLKEKNDPNAPAAEATFSVIDLSPEKWLPVRKAYDTFGKDVLACADKNPYLYGALDVAALDADRYGITQGSMGLTMDLKAFVDRTRGILTNSTESELYEISNDAKRRLTKDATDLISAVEAAVVFNVAGENKSNSNGLAVHYPLNKNPYELVLYAAQRSTSKSMRTLYTNMFPNLPADFSLPNGEENKSSGRSAGTRGKSKSQQLDEIFDLSDLSNLAVQVDQVEDKVSVQLTKAQMRKLSDIRCLLAGGMVEDTPAADLGAAMGLATDEIFFLGESTNVHRKWDGDVCTITDNFDASWLMLNNHPVFVGVLETRNDTVDENGTVTKSGYTTYGIPLVINDKDGYLLKVIHRHGENKYQIIGANKSGKSVGRTNRGFTQLAKGDKVTPLFLVCTRAKDTDTPDTPGFVAKFTGDGESFVFKYVPGASFTLETEPAIENATLPDGSYLYLFEFVNPRNAPARSHPAYFDVSEGDIYVGEIEDSGDTVKEVTVETADGKAYNVDLETRQVTEVDS